MVWWNLDSLLLDFHFSVYIPKMQRLKQFHVQCISKRSVSTTAYQQNIRCRVLLCSNISGHELTVTFYVLNVDIGKVCWESLLLLYLKAHLYVTFFKGGFFAYNFQCFSMFVQFWIWRVIKKRFMEVVMEFETTVYYI